MEFAHRSVLLRETIEYLGVRPDGVYADGTIGGGGHSLEICKRLDGGHLYGFDQDEAAVEAASKRLANCGDRFTIIRSNFKGMSEELVKRGVTSVDGILLDLGVSSYQLDEARRGFSYRFDAPLDMRMDTSAVRTAADVVNSYDETRLACVIRDYGEERFAKRIAGAICTARQSAPIKTTGELVDIIRRAMPKRQMQRGGHPAKRTFQALRIEVNSELEVLEASLDGMISMLGEGGRLCVITFHSLEDRIVKNAFKRNEDPCTCPPGFPVCVCGKKPKGFCVTKKPVVPSEEEIRENARSHSAKLRVFEKRSQT